MKRTIVVKVYTDKRTLNRLAARAKREGVSRPQLIGELLASVTDSAAAGAPTRRRSEE